MPPPGKELRRYRPPLIDTCARVPYRLEDPQRKPPSIDALLVSRETSSHRVIVMRRLALSDPLLVAGGIIGAVCPPQSWVMPRSRRSLTTNLPAHGSVSDTHTTSPLPQKEGKELHPPFHVKPWGSPVLPVDARLDRP